MLIVGAAVAFAGVLYLMNSPGIDPAIESIDSQPLYNPVHAGEELPSGFRQLIPRDGIRPIYDPTFLSAAQTTWPDNTLVIGVEIDGDAKAYPVNFLTRREIVNDHVGRTPVLVTW